MSRRSDLLLLLEPSTGFDARGGPKERVRLHVRVTKLPGTVVEAELVASIDYVLCQLRDSAACTPGHIDLRIPVRLLEKGGRAISFAVPLPGVDNV